MPVCPHPACQCGKKKITAEQLLEHVRSSSWGSMYYCPRCKCVCSSDANLRKHNAKTHPTVQQPSQRTPPPPAQSTSNPNVCTICNRACASPAALQQHYRDVSVHPKCARCNLGFRDNTAIQDHVAAIHLPTSCRACNGLQVYQADVASHYRTSPNHPTCSLCNVGLENAEALASHYKTSASHPNCALCDVGFERVGDLAAHYKSSSRHPICTLCDMGFKDDGALANHYLESGQHPICVGCRIGFRDTGAMQEHTISVHPAYRCVIHNQFFGTPALLDAHYQDSEEHPKCPECHMAFADTLALIEHGNATQHVIQVFDPIFKSAGRLMLEISKINMPDESDTESRVSDETEETHHSEPVMPSTAATNGGSPVDTRPSSVTLRLGEATSEGVFQDLTDLVDATTVSSAPSIVSESSPSPISRQPIPPSSPTEPVTVSNLQASPVESQPQVTSSSNSPRDLLASQRSLLDSSRLSQYVPVSRAQRFGDEDARAVVSPLRVDSREHDFFMSSTEALKSATVTPVSSLRGSLPRWSTVLQPPAPLVDSPSDIRSRSRSRSRTGSIRTASMPPVVVQPSFFSFSTAPERSLSLLSDVTRDAFANSAITENLQRTPSLRSVRDVYQGLDMPSDHTRVPSVASNLPHTMMPTPTLTATQRHPSSSSPSLVDSSSKRASSEGKGEETKAAQATTHKTPRVSHIYCRMCRRDPCRSATATMCGHIFCHSCISSKVMKEPYCPVCEAPTLLYSLVRLHIA